MEREFVLSVYARHLQEVWRETISQNDLLTLLYNAVSQPVGLKNKNFDDFQVDSDHATKVFNRKTGGNAPLDIRRYAGDQRVLDSVVGYFQQKVMRYIPADKVPHLVFRLNTILQLYDFFSVEKRAEMAALAKEHRNVEFLAYTFLLSLQPRNVPGKKKPDEPSGTHADDLIILRDKYAAVGKYIQLPGLDKPDEPLPEEENYLEEAFKAYGSHLRKPVCCKDDLPFKFQLNLEVNRNDYYKADAVLIQGVDALPGLTMHQFEILMEEVLDSVMPTYVESLGADGYECMKSVLHEAARLEYHKSLFCDVGWIDAPEKRGICHMLAGEKKLRWVIDDE